MRSNLKILTVYFLILLNIKSFKTNPLNPDRLTSGKFLDLFQTIQFDNLDVRIWTSSNFSAEYLDTESLQRFKRSKMSIALTTLDRKLSNICNKCLTMTIIEAIFIYTPDQLMEAQKKLNIELGNKAGRQPIYFIWISKQLTKTAVLHFLEKISKKLWINSNFFIFYEYPKEILEVYRLKELTIIQAILMEQENGQLVRLYGNKYARRRKNFHQIQFVANSPNDEYFSNIVSTEIDKNGQIVFTHGIAVEIYRQFRDMLNFSEKAVLGDWLHTDANSPDNLSGLTYDQLNSGEVDISIAQLTLLPFRAKAFTFLQPTFPYWIEAYFRQPSLSTIRTVFISPFSPTLWILFAINWIIVAISIKIISTKCFHILPEEILDTDLPIWTIGAICQKGVYAFTKDTATKIAMSTGFVVSMLTYVAYSAALVSILKTPVVPVQSFFDLLNHNFKLLIHQDSNTVNHIVKDLLQIYERTAEIRQIVMEQEVDIYTTKSALVYFSDAVYPVLRSYNFSDNYICRSTYSVRVGHFPVKSGMFMKKGSPFKKIFNIQIIRLMQSGINYRHISHYKLATEPTCDEPSRKSYREMEINDLFTAFTLIAIGNASSLIILFVECFYKMCKFKKCNKCNNNSKKFQVIEISLKVTSYTI